MIYYINHLNIKNNNLKLLKKNEKEDLILISKNQLKYVISKINYKLLNNSKCNEINIEEEEECCDENILNESFEEIDLTEVIDNLKNLNI